MVPRETGNNAYAKSWRDNEEFYSIFDMERFHSHD